MPEHRDDVQPDDVTHGVEEVAAEESAATPGAGPESGTDDAAGTAEETTFDPVVELEARVAELTNDLQRKQAEFINYKRRVEDDRVRAVETGKQRVLTDLLTVLDDLGRAEEHGELTGGFKAVADSLTQTLSKFGLESFGAVGDAFDPQIHEAVFHAGESAEAEVTSIAQVMRTGYRVGDKILRPATVGVVDPAPAQND